MTKPDLSLCENIIREYLLPFMDDPDCTRIQRLAPDRLRVRGSRSARNYEQIFQCLPAFPWLGRIGTKRGKEIIKEYLPDHLCRIANTTALARAMRAKLKPKLCNTTQFVHGRIRIRERNEDGTVAFREVQGTTYLQSRLGTPSGPGTNLFLLHGNAGSGKSLLLMMVAYQQTHEILQSQDQVLFLYVDAQGLNLRSLEQQISYQLDLYGGGLRFFEVVPLIRLGRIVLIVDGFDELILPMGYNDTVNALVAYLGNLKGEGTVLASARSAFFHSFDLSAAYEEVPYEITQVELEMTPWLEEERFCYLEMRGLSSLAPDLEALASHSEAGRQLLGRPFVVAQLSDILRSGSRLDEQELMSQIERSFLGREVSQKLLRVENGQPILEISQLEDVLVEVAIEMWLLQQTVLDIGTLEEVVELVLEGKGLDRSTIELMRQRMAVNPLLSLVPTQSQKKQVQFPHEMLFSRFMAKGLLHELKQAGPGVRKMLGTAVLSEAILEQLELMLGSNAYQFDGLEGYFQSLAKVSASIVTKTLASNSTRKNLASLFLAGLRLRREDEHLEVAHGVFDRVSFAGANVSGVVFLHCEFGDVDGRGLDWSGASFKECTSFQRLLITKGQEFPSSLPDVVWLSVEEASGKVTEYYGVTATREVLIPAEITGAPEVPELSTEARQVSTLLQRICRRALKVFWLCPAVEDSDDPAMRRIKQDPYWPLVLELLERHSLLRSERRSRKGVNAEMVHIERAEEILRGSGGDYDQLSDPVKALWSEVVSL